MEEEATGSLSTPPVCDEWIDDAELETVPDDASAGIDEHAGEKEDADRSQSSGRESCAFAIECEGIDIDVVVVTVMVAAHE